MSDDHTSAPWGTLIILAALIALAFFVGNPGGDSVVLPGEGLRVLIVEEVDDRTPEIAEVINGDAVRSYLDSHCQPGKDGAPQYRIFDDDMPQGNLPETWQEALKLAEETPEPAIVITDGRRGFVGPLPLPAEKTLELLRKYGGK